MGCLESCGCAVLVLALIGAVIGFFVRLGWRMAERR